MNKQKPAELKFY